MLLDKCWRKKTLRKNKEKMPVQHNCSLCTAAVCDTKVYSLCTACHSVPAFTCFSCLVDVIHPPTTCNNCTVRPHICLSPCLRRCLRAKGPPAKCRCGIEARRCRVGKPGRTQGRFFQTCAQGKCKYFEWAQ
jgi:hypothetical protein